LCNMSPVDVDWRTRKVKGLMFTLLVGCGVEEKEGEG
jgi:hypothetical protein